MFGLHSCQRLSRDQRPRLQLLVPAAVVEGHRRLLAAIVAVSAVAALPTSERKGLRRQVLARRHGSSANSDSYPLGQITAGNVSKRQEKAARGL